MTETHRIQIGSVTRDLPIREVAPGVSVALFDMLGDWELAEAAGKKLAFLTPLDVDALVMPDGKATALLHVMGRTIEIPIFVARKEKKPYMKAPLTSVSVKSITTDSIQTLCIGADTAEKLRGKKVAIVDDVVSSGGTLIAMKKLLNEVEAIHVATMAIFTEGDQRDDVITLRHIPLF